MKICVICREEITETGRWHESVCGSKCAKERYKRNRRITDKTRNARYRARNKTSTRRKYEAEHIWHLEDKGSGTRWTRLYGETG